LQPADVTVKEENHIRCFAIDIAKYLTPFLSSYHPSLEKIAGIVRHHWKEIEKSETLAKLFPEPPVVAFRQPKSIKGHFC
jgi:hypothetical protein